MKHKLMNQEEHDYLTEFFKIQHTQLSIEQQQKLLAIYQRTVNKDYRVSSSCGGCWKSLISSLKQMYNQI